MGRWFTVGLLVVGLAGCDLIPELSGEGSYDMADLGVRQVELAGELGPLSELDGDIESSDGVSCPGEMFFTFTQRQGDEEMQLDIALNEPIPPMDPGDVFRVETASDHRLTLMASVWGGDESWSGESTQAEMIVHYRGLDIYQMAFVAVMSDGQSLPTEISGTFTMDRAAGMADELPF